jgi:hypothetical protein
MLEHPKFRLEDHEIYEWLSPRDAYISASLLTLNGSAPQNVCEIGSWKGGFVVAVLTNTLNVRMVSIDPYPGLKKIKIQFFDELEKRGLSNQVDWFPTKEIFSQNSNIMSFDLIHIDGEHSEVAVLEDLLFAEKNLAIGGIIAIDDIWHQDFPGIASAVFKFCHESEFVPFLISGPKIYLNRESEHEVHHNHTKEMLEEGKIEYSEGFKVNTFGETFTQSNAIKGFGQIILQNDTASMNKFYRANSLEQKLNFSKSFKNLSSHMLPPFVNSILKFLYRNFQGLVR